MIDTLLTIGLIMVLLAVGAGLIIGVAWIAAVCWYDLQARRRREGLTRKAAGLQKEMQTEICGRCRYYQPRQDLTRMKAIDKAIREEEDREE